MSRPFRKRRLNRVAFAALLLVIAAVVLRRQSNTDDTAAWLPPGEYRVQHVVDERRLLLRSCKQPELAAPVGLLGTAAPAPWPDRLRRVAQQRLSRLTKQQIVRLRLDRRRITPEGELLGYVFVGENLLNADLVEHGLAVAATRPEDCHAIVQRIKRAEDVARAEKRGIWKKKSKPEA